MKRVLILGGGVGGLSLANWVRRGLPAEDDVLLVDRAPQHEFRPVLLGVAVGAVASERARRDWTPLASRGIRLLRGNVERIVPDARSAVIDGRTWEADILVVSLGAARDTSAIPGLSEGGLDFYDATSAAALGSRLAGLERGTLLITIPAGPLPAALAPYEFAFVADHQLRGRGVRRDVRIRILSGPSEPLAVAGPETTAAVAHWCEERDISWAGGVQVERVDPLARLVRLGDGREEAYDLLVGLAPPIAPQPVRTSPLAGPDGWIDVDPLSCATAWEGVYALGDATRIRVSGGFTLPKAGVFAHGQAQALARTIIHELTARGAPGRYDGEGETFVEMGAGLAAVVCGHYYSQPHPRVLVMHPTPQWRAARMAVTENWWRNYLS